MTAQTTFRAATEQDFSDIALWPRTREELYYFAPRAPWPICAEALQEIASNRLSPTIAEVTGLPAGYANFYRHSDGRLAVGNLVISPEYRGAGIASALMQQMEDQARHQFGENTLSVACFNCNTSALQLYHQRGYTPQSLETRQGPEGETVVLIQLQRNI